MVARFVFDRTRCFASPMQSLERFRESLDGYGVGYQKVQKDVRRWIDVAQLRTKGGVFGISLRVGLGRGWIRHLFRSGRFATRGFALLPPAPSSFWMRWDEGFAAVEELNKSL